MIIGIIIILCYIQLRHHLPAATFISSYFSRESSSSFLIFLLNFFFLGKTKRKGDNLEKGFISLPMGKRKIKSSSKNQEAIISIDDLGSNTSGLTFS